MYSRRLPAATANAPGTGRDTPPWSCISVPCPGSHDNNHTSHPSATSTRRAQRERGVNWGRHGSSAA
ncbi:MAG TPA: hypothetical protein VE172_06330 [Stackebrandtia sp.]|nr:hypothetical protein [Stackebrandtia sp.]HZE38413.1 hypothetical protein [Stackebrandtia sp.]